MLKKPFIKLRSIQTFKMVAKSLAMMESASNEIEAIRKKLNTREGLSGDLDLAMRELSFFSDMNASEARTAINRLKVLRSKVEKYRKDLDI